MKKNLLKSLLLTVCLSSGITAYSTDLYLLGQTEATNYEWSYSNGAKMTPGTADGVYYITTRIAQTADSEESGTFGFTTQLGSSWDEISSYRNGPEADGTQILKSTSPTNIWSNSSTAFKCDAGVYCIIVDLNNNKIIAAPEKLYAVGTLNYTEKGDWDPTDDTHALLPDNDVPGLYAGTMTVKSTSAADTYGYFGISSQLGDWTTFNNARIGGPTSNELITVGNYSGITYGENAFKILGDNSYYVKVDLVNKTISASFTTGVTSPSTKKVVRAIGENGSVRVLGNAQSIEVYTASGLLISRDKAETNCDAGIYIVKIDGNTQKVVVR